MEGVESEHANFSDESEEEENCLKNAYSVGDLLGELSSDNDLDTKYDGNNPDSTIEDPCDTFCQDSNMSMDNISNVTSEKPANTTLEDEVLECHATPDTDASVPFPDTYSQVYDEVLTENIYQDPVEAEDCLVTSM